jgi:hypothetical protein
MTIKPITTRMRRASPLPDEIPSPMAIRRICGVTAWDATVRYSAKSATLPFRACRPVTANLKVSRRNGVSSIPRGRTGTHRIKSATEQVRAGHDARQAATMAGHGALHRPCSPRDFPPCVPVRSIVTQIAPYAGAGHLGHRLDRIVTMAQNGPATSFQSTRKSTT